MKNEEVIKVEFGREFKMSRLHHAMERERPKISKN